MGLEHRLNQYPNQLSAGERQRVAIARSPRQQSLHPAGRRAHRQSRQRQLGAHHGAAHRHSKSARHDPHHHHPRRRNRPRRAPPHSHARRPHSQATRSSERTARETRCCNRRRVSAVFCRQRSVRRSASCGYPSHPRRTRASRSRYADYRATGRLVTIDAGGKRINYAITIKAHWFPGRSARADRHRSPSGATARSNPHPARDAPAARTRSALRIRVPQAWSLCPTTSGTTMSYGGTFSYEDFLESQYYWQNQSILKTAQLRRAQLRRPQKHAGALRPHPLRRSRILARPHHRLPGLRRKDA